MSKFIEPPYEKVDHSRYSHLKNVAINIENVDGIKKDRYHVYPDNAGIPILIFLGTKNNNDSDVIPINGVLIVLVIWNILIKVLLVVSMNGLRRYNDNKSSE